MSFESSNPLILVPRTTADTGAETQSKTAKRVLPGLPSTVWGFLSGTADMVPAIESAERAHQSACDTFTEVLESVWDLQGSFERERDQLQIAQAVTALIPLWLSFSRHSFREERRRVRSARGRLRHGFASRNAAERRAMVENALFTPLCNALRSQGVPLIIEHVRRFMGLIANAEWTGGIRPGGVLARQWDLFGLQCCLQDLLDALHKVECERLAAETLAQLTVGR